MTKFAQKKNALAVEATSVLNKKDSIAITVKILPQLINKCNAFILRMCCITFVLLAVVMACTLFDYGFLIGLLQISVQVVLIFLAYIFACKAERLD